MLSYKRYRAGIGGIGGIGAIAAGVTYTVGLTSSPATLASNTIAASTSLSVSTDNVTYSGSTKGFNFTGMVPGGAGSPNQTFYLKNTGSNALALNLATLTSPTFTVVPNTVTVDKAHVFANVACTSGSSGSFSLTSDLKTLKNSGAAVTGGPLAAGDIATCTISVSMDSRALSATASGLSSSGFIFDFNGTSGS